jgi:hypothetical protein
LSFCSSILPTTTEPSSPAFSAIWRAGACSAADDLDADLLVVVLGLTLSSAARRAAAPTPPPGRCLLRPRRGWRAARRRRGPSLLHLDLGRAADADDRDAAGELGQTLLQLLAVVVRGGLLDLRLDLRDAGLDVGLLAGAVDDRGVFLVDR